MASGTHGQAGSGGMKGGSGPSSGASKMKGTSRGTEGQGSGNPGLAELPRSGGIMNQTPPKAGGGAPPQSGKFVGTNRGTEGDNAKGFGGGLQNPPQGGSTSSYSGTDDASR